MVANKAKTVEIPLGDDKSPLFMHFSTAFMQKTRIKCGKNACTAGLLM